MTDILDFFQGLFATNKWPPRWKCGEWSDFLGWMYIVSELMIWTSYFLIPMLILNYIRSKKASVKFQKVYVLFASFILLCGSTHFIDAMMFWIPMYRFNALVRLATGIISLSTVYHLILVLPQVFKQKTNLELEKEILRREEAEKKLAEANKDLEAFAYIASHDLQEPLRKIRTYSSMLYNSNIDSFDEKSKGLADKVISSSERMQSMIKDVLTLSTINADAEFTNVNPADAVKNALDDLEIKILETQADVHIENLSNVKGNFIYLSQLFMNLIGNAIKFTKVRPVIHIFGREEDNKVLIFVKDNGIGMNAEDAEKIFTPFQRLHTRREYEGTGIGLSICKKIVELHKGSISVDSKLGEGTTFIIELPKAES
jgi:signal transduction histidine kinase